MISDKGRNGNALTTPAFCVVCGSLLPVPRTAKRKYCDEHVDTPYKVWRQMHRVYEQERGKRYKADNPESVKNRNKHHYHNNKEYHRKKYQKWKLANPERRREIDRSAAIRNRDRRLEQARERMAASPRARLHRAVSRQVLYTLRTGKGGQTWEELLGYRVETLMAHLESQFTKGMTWDNYGKWHVDHIKPVSHFSFESIHDPEFLECWSLWNLQPLWGRDNVRKSNNCDAPPLPLLHREEATP